MPDAARDAVKECIQTSGAMDEQSASDYMERMDKTKRYQAETWS